MSMYGFVGFYAGGKTKGLYEVFVADLLNLGMETMDYLASVDYDRFVLRAKQWMDQAQTIYEDDPAIPVGKWKELQEFLESSEDEVPVTLRYDFSEFMYNSLLCADAYIINLDTNELEYYVGPNFKRNENGRYSDSPPERFAQVNIGLDESINKLMLKGASPEEIESAIQRNYGVRKIFAISISFIQEMKAQEIRRLIYFINWVSDMALSRKKCRGDLALYALYTRCGIDLDENDERDIATMTKEEREAIINKRYKTHDELFLSNDDLEDDLYREMLTEAG